MAIQPTKDNDIGFDDKRSPKQGDQEEDQDENYEIAERVYFTTLRKSSAFTIETFAKKYQAEVFFVLQGHLENQLFNPQAWLA